MRIDSPWLDDLSGRRFDMRFRQQADVETSQIYKASYTEPIYDNEYVQLGYIRESRLQQKNFTLNPSAISPYQSEGLAEIYMEIRDTSAGNAIGNFLINLAFRPPASGTISAAVIIYDFLTPTGYRLPGLTTHPSDPVIGQATQGYRNAYSGAGNQTLPNFRNIIVRRDPIPGTTPTQYGLGIRINLSPSLIGSNLLLGLTVSGTTPLIKA